MSLPMTEVMQIYDFRWDLVFSNWMQNLNHNHQIVDTHLSNRDM